MADQSLRRPIIRCPDCKIGMLITPVITVRLETTKRLKLPLKVCHRCKIVVLHDRTWQTGWKIWNRKEYIPKPE